MAIESRQENLFTERRKTIPVDEQRVAVIRVLGGESAACVAADLNVTKEDIELLVAVGLEAVEAALWSRKKSKRDRELSILRSAVVHLTHANELLRYRIKYLEKLCGPKFK